MDGFIQILIQFEQVLETWTGAWMANYITQCPAVKAWSKLGFVQYSTSSPNTDLEYNWKTCRKRKKICLKLD